MKLITDHKCRPNNLMLSPFMERILEKVSESSGRNSNNQVSKSHGIQVLILREAQKLGINTKQIYNGIKH